jgi:hypothetical protein
MARYFSFPSVEKMFQAETKIGDSEIAFELMGFNPAMVACNITTCNEEEEEVFERISKEVQGPGFFLILAGNSAPDFEYKKLVLNKIISDADGKSLKSVEDPRTEGILLMFKSIPVMGQRDLTINWASGAGKAKEPLIEKGLIVDDGGAFFGWGVEQGHLGKTEIFCKFDPLNTEAKEAVEGWHKAQSQRAFDEKYFALLMGPTDEIGPGMSNYHLWWNKIRETLDPNGVTPDASSLV